MTPQPKPTDIVKSTSSAIADLLQQRKPELLALQSKYLTPERLTRVLINCLSRSPALAACTVSSLYRCALSCAELGLEPGGILGHAYLIPYGTEATLIIGFRGMMELARRSGIVNAIETHVVHQGDDFELEFGLTPKLMHRPKMGNTGAPLAVYCVARLANGLQHIEVMGWADVMKIRDKSRAAKSGPWVDFTEEMARKTVVRRAFKYLPTSELLTDAMEHDGDEVEVNAPPVDMADEVTATQKAKASVKRRLQIEDSTPAEVVDPEVAEREAAIQAEQAAKAQSAKPA